MLNIKKLVFDDEGRLVSMTGDISKKNFKPRTRKILFWANMDLDYAGG